jgi:hypothetical protein
MKTIIFIMISFISISSALAQVDKEKLALETSKADALNNEKLKAFIWKRNTDVMVNGELKLTTVTELSFDDQGKLLVRLIDSESTVKNKPGIRGRIQDNAIEENLDYVGKALELAIAYTYMSKGQLLDFFDKGTVTEAGNMVQVTAKDVYIKGDSLAVVIDSATGFFVSKHFSSLLDQDPISGEITYETFSSGINHSTGSVMNLPAKKARIEAINQDYSQRIQ